jgi:hypothetical protein
VRVAALVLAACALLVLSSRGAGAGDPELAKFLLKGAKEDLAKKAYDGAKSKLERAETEDPTLLEAVYLQAVVAERRGEGRAAAPIYRRFVDACAAKAKDGAGPSKEEGTLLKEAQKRLEVLAGAETERAKLDDAFVGALLSFAESHFVKDPPIAARALKVLLTVRPTHEEARSLLAKLGEAVPDLVAGDAEAPEKGATTSAAAFKAVKKWDEYLDNEWFTEQSGFEKRDGVLVADAPGGGQILKPPETTHTGSRYAVEAEVRLVEEFEGKEAGIGFVFAFSAPGELYLLLVNARSAVLHRAQDGDNGDQFRTDVSPPGIGTFHRIGVVVRDLKITVFVDGKQVTELTATGRTDLQGDVALFTQNCKAEVRSLRRGALP